MTTRLIAVVALLGTVILGGASPAAAAISLLGPLTVTAPATFVRGPNATAADVTVDVPATESASFVISLAAPFVIDAAGNTCTADAPATGVCTYTAVTNVVTLADDGNNGNEEVTTIHVHLKVKVNPVDLASTEGNPTMSAPATVSATATPQAGTGGGAQVGSTGTVITANTTMGTGDAVIELTTTAPTGAPGSPAPSVNRGTTTPYTATLTRSGNTAQTTVVHVDLIVDTPSGTTIVDPATKDITFNPAQTSKPVSFTVNVPAGATPGEATYHFRATYDPTSTDGAPTDTETGRQASFLIVAPNPSVSLRLESTVADDSTVTRGQGPITFTLTAKNEAAAGALNADNISVTLPVTGDVTIGALIASAGTAGTTGASPSQTVTWNTFSLAPQATATLSIPITVKPTAAKVAPTGSDPDPNDIKVGEASGTFQPPPGTAATLTGSPTQFTYEISPRADVTIAITGPANVTINPDEADITGRYIVSNAGPDPAAGVFFVANPPNPLAGGSLTAGDIVEGAGWTCNIQGGNNVRCDLTGSLGIASSTPVDITWTINGGGDRHLVATVTTSTTEVAGHSPNTFDLLVGVIDPNAGVSSSAQACTPLHTAVPCPPASAGPDTALVAGGTTPVNDEVIVDYVIHNDGPHNVKVQLSVTPPTGTTLLDIDQLNNGPGTECPDPPYVAPVICDVDRINNGQDVTVRARYLVTAAAGPPGAVVNFTAQLTAKPGSTVIFNPQNPTAPVTLALPAVNLSASVTPPVALEILSIAVGQPSASTVRTFTVHNNDPVGGTASPRPQVKVGMPTGVSALAAAGCTGDPAPLNGAPSGLICDVTAPAGPLAPGAQANTSAITFIVSSSTPNEVTIQYTATDDTTLRRLVPTPAVNEFKLDINFNPVAVADLGPVVPAPGSVVYKVLANDTDSDGAGQGGPGTLTVTNPIATITAGTQLAGAGAPVITPTVLPSGELSVVASNIVPTDPAKGLTVRIDFGVFDGSGTTASSLLVNLRPTITHSGKPRFGYTRTVDGLKSLGVDVDPTLVNPVPEYSTLDPFAATFLGGDLAKRVQDATGTLSPTPITNYVLSGRTTPALDTVGATGGSNVDVANNLATNTPEIRYTSPKGYTTDPISNGTPGVMIETAPPHDGFKYIATHPDFTVNGGVDVAIPNANPIAIDDTVAVVSGTSAKSSPTLNDADANTLCQPKSATDQTCLDTDPYLDVNGTPADKTDDLPFDDEGDFKDPKAGAPIQICAIGPVPAAVSGVIPDPKCPPKAGDPDNGFAALGLSPPDKVVELPAGVGKIRATLRATFGTGEAFEPSDPLRRIDISTDITATGLVPLAYVAVDARGGLDFGQLNIDVPNTPPDPAGDVQTVFKNTPKIVVDARGVLDQNQDNVLIQTASDPANGKVTIGDDRKTITYSPNRDFLGLDCPDPNRCTFNYTVVDSNGGSGSATVKIQVVENPLTTVRGTGGTSAAGTGGTLPATGFGPVLLTLTGGVAILLGAGLAVAGGRRRVAAFVPLHVRR